MTDGSLEVPSTSDLIHLPVEVVPEDEPGVVSVTAHAADCDTVTLVWDVIARSVTIRWMSSHVVRVRMERELATKVSVLADEGAVEFLSWIRASDLGGHLVVRVAESVSISDAILRM